MCMRRLDAIRASTLRHFVETKITESVARRRREGLASLGQGHLRALDAFHHAGDLGAYATADEAGLPPFQPPVPDARLGAEFGLERLEPFPRRLFLHGGVLELHRLEHGRWAGLLAAGLTPSLIEQMGVEDPGLRDLLLLIPDDRPIGAGPDNVLAALGLHWIDDDDAVIAFADGVAGVANAGRIVAVIAHHRQIGGLDHGRAALDAAQDADRAVPDGGGRRRIAGEVVADMFVPLRDDAVIAVLAAPDVDDQVPLAHGLPPSRHELDGPLYSGARALEGVCGAPLLDLHQAGIGRHAAGATGLRAVGGEHVQTAADLDRFSGDFDELELGAGLIGLDHAQSDQRGNVGRADHGAAIVEDLHEIAMADAPGGGVGGIEPQQVEAMAGDERAMVLNLTDGAVLSVS